MSNYEATKYDFSGANLTGIEGIPTGTIVPWSSSSVPTGFLECNGQAVSRSTYSDLFAIVSTTYGAGGANTVQSTGNVGGSTGNHTLSTPEIPSHSHPGGASSVQQQNVGPPYQGGAGPAGTGSTGGGGAHQHNMSATFTGDSTSVLQPYLTVLYVIKT